MSEPEPAERRLPATVEDVEAAVHHALERIEAREKEEERHARAEADRKERLTQRVSLAALILTMLLSFLGFARSGNDGDSTDAKTDAARAKSDVAAQWALYQTKAAQRSEYAVSRDALVREVMDLPAGDPRVRRARFDDAQYEERIRRIDDENRQVFFVIQDQVKREILLLRKAARLDQRTARYDLGTRVLTLALVLISVTLLADREYLFWTGLLVALIGAAIAVNGYFLWL